MSSEVSVYVCVLYVGGHMDGWAQQHKPREGPTTAGVSGGYHRVLETWEYIRRAQENLGQYRGGILRYIH